VACALFATSQQNAVAIDLSLTAPAEAGLDPATREFIKNLPDDWRPKIAKIVDDTMNRVDLSVATYLKEIDKLQCRVIGTEKGVVDDIVRRFPWVKKTGPIEGLRNDIATQSARRRDDSSPTFIKDLYNDLMLAASVVSCQSGAIPTAQADIRAIMVDFGGRWLVWNRATSIGCKTAVECSGSYRKVVEEVVRTSDQRDVEASGAQQRLATFKAPYRSEWLEWLPNWLTERWAGPAEFDPLEAALTELYAIENSVGGAQAIRESDAIKKLKNAQKTTDVAKSQIDTTYSAAFQQPGFMGIAFHDNCEKFFGVLVGDKLKQPRALLAEAKQELDTAVTTASLIRQDADAQAALIATQVKRATEPAIFCKG